MPDEKIDEKRPAHAENEPQVAQQRIVDDTVDDSFPASDPPAWTTTGAKSVAARSEEGGSPSQPADRRRAGESGPQDRMRETAHRAADQVSRLAHDALERGAHYVDSARDRYPEAERRLRQGARAVARPVQEYPLAALLAAGLIGYALAWFIHRRGSSIGSWRTSGTRAWQSRSPAKSKGPWQGVARPVSRSGPDAGSLSQRSH
jgi:hypothetical protein